MTLIELYEEIGGNYEELILRFVKEARVGRFLKMFLADETFAEFRSAVDSENWEAAFQAAHTLKALVGNMSFSALYDSIFTLTEELRGGKPLQSRELYMLACTQYDNTVAAVTSYLSQAD